PHIEHGPRFIRYAARVPGRIPYDVDLDLAHAGNTRHRVLDHSRQLLRRRTVGRGERHIDRDRAIIRDIDLVDETQLVDVGGNLRIVDGLERGDDVVGHPRQLALRQRRRRGRGGGKGGFGRGGGSRRGAGG